MGTFSNLDLITRYEVSRDAGELLMKATKAKLAGVADWGGQLEVIRILKA